MGKAAEFLVVVAAVGFCAAAVRHKFAFPFVWEEIFDFLLP